MKKEIFLDDLNETGVSILTKKYLEENGQKYYVGSPHRQAYANNSFDIERLKKNIDEPYLSCILKIWENKMPSSPAPPERNPDFLIKESENKS